MFFLREQKAVSTKSLQSRWTPMPSTIILFTFLRPFQINRHLFVVRTNFRNLRLINEFVGFYGPIKLNTEPMDVFRIKDRQWSSREYLLTSSRVRHFLRAFWMRKLSFSCWESCEAKNSLKIHLVSVPRWLNNWEGLIELDRNNKLGIRLLHFIALSHAALLSGSKRSILVSPDEGTCQNESSNLWIEARYF